jgi:hypothetical protein
MIRASTPSQPRQLRFALNAHGPSFEVYGLLCVASLRHWCGERVAIRVYRPDNLPPCSDRALQFLARRNVEVVDFHNPWLPDRLEDPRAVPPRHLTYNKLFTLLDVQEGEQRVFLDADQILLGDPTPLLLAQCAPAGLVAADTPESFVGDWDELYRRMGVAPTSRRIEIWETYTFGKQPEPARIATHPYFCSGLVSVTDNSALPELWLHFSRELERQIDTLTLSYFVDQVSLPLAAAASGQSWELLSNRCSATPHVFRFIEDPLHFHYWQFHALAAQAARTPLLHAHLKQITGELKRETGIDLRFQLLTQWPRWYGRTRQLARNQMERLGLIAAKPSPLR